MHPIFYFAAITLPLTLAAPSRLPVTVVRRQTNDSSSTEGGSCNLASVKQPASSLPAPDAELDLVLIALGHGTQNYTCANASSAPAAIGAVAQLFNVSCAVASNAAFANDNDGLGSVTEDASAIGAHFFVDTTTPDFDIIGLGNTELKKNASTPAPNPSSDVAWLFLKTQQQGTTSPVKDIYRLNTKGGVAPSTCAGQADGSVITIDYEAQYWVYAAPEQVAARRHRRGGRGRRP